MYAYFCNIKRQLGKVCRFETCLIKIGCMGDLIERESVHFLF